MSERRSWWVMVVVAAALSGCVPVPVLSPPMKVGMGAALATGDFSDDPAVDDSGGQLAVGVTAGVHPLQFFEGLDEFDAGAGVIFEAVPDQRLGANPLLGGYAEAGLRLWQRGKIEEGAGRLFVLGRGELLNELGGDSQGVGLSLGLGLDLVSWEDNEVAAIGVQASSQGAVVSSFLGYAYGQSGIGAELSLNFRQIGEVQYNAVFLKLTFRVPVTAGFYLVPVL